MSLRSMETPKKEYFVNVEYRTDSELSSLSSPRRDDDSQKSQDRFATLRRLYDKTNDWRFGVLTCAVSTFIVFLINLIVTIWAAARYGSDDGLQILFEGNCDQAGKLNTALHLAINVLGTVLLSSSNYCMQCLSAPTRKEVDKAHAKGRWLDIGILSTRNLWGISKKRVLMWWILGMSSLPLHLFYNSVVFSSIVSNITIPIQVSSAFVDAGTAGSFLSTSGCTVNETTINQYLQGAKETCIEWYDTEAYRLRKLNAQGSLERLENLACVNAYSRPFQTRGNVLLVTDDSTSSINMPPNQYGNYLRCDGDNNWVCGCSYDNDPPCDLNPKLKGIQSKPDEWSPLNDRVAYCLAENVPQFCKVQSSLNIAIVVICLNLFKAAIMLYLATQTKETPFMTVGDAIASYIEVPDAETKDMCIVSRADLEKQPASWVRGGRVMSPGRQRLFTAASMQRWIFCISFYVVILLVITGLLAFALVSILSNYSGDWQTIWGLGIGEASTVTTLALDTPDTGTNGLTSNVFVANVAQPILSFMYFMYNGLFTAMCGALEWESFFQNRKGLRVSGDAGGHQRSTYFLALPYRFGLPLMVLSSVLHWLVSQSIFLVDIDYRSYSSGFGWRSERSELSCGYSPLAIILTLIAGVLMLIAIGAFGSMRLKSNMPVVANSSAAIAAACQMPVEEHEKGASQLKLQWGVTGYDEDGVGHCSFSSFPVEPPKGDRMYK